MAGQFEGFTQAIQRLRRRKISVQLPQSDRVLRLKTLTVPRPLLTLSRLEGLKTPLARKDGLSCHKLRRREHDQRSQGNYTVDDFEILGKSSSSTTVVCRPTA